MGTFSVDHLPAYRAAAAGATFGPRKALGASAVADRMVDERISRVYGWDARMLL